MSSAKNKYIECYTRLPMMGIKKPEFSFRLLVLNLIVSCIDTDLDISKLWVRIFYFCLNCILLFPLFALLEPPF